MKPQTLAIHAGRSVDPTTGAVSEPIHMSSTYERSADGSYASGFMYGRDNNPNRLSFETCVCALEEGDSALAFASGMAAVCSVLEAHAPDGKGYVLIPDDMYFGVKMAIQNTDIGQRFDFVEVDMVDVDAVASAIESSKPTLVWLETPSNPLIKVVDIKAIATVARQHGALVAVDNTWATPILQKPLELGADISVHSATKYIGGHSDLTLGIAILKQQPELVERLKISQKLKGAVPSPFDCWLALRGLQSLVPRMKMHCENAKIIAEFLKQHPSVEQVLYPGLPEHPGHEIAAKQMSDFGGMLSFIVKGNAEQTMAVAAKLKLIVSATSLGGTHTLIEHRASVEGEITKAPSGLLRLSVGLEHPEDLIDDLSSGLALLNQ